MPLSPAEFRENLTRRFAETLEQDERAIAAARAKLPEAVRLISERLGPRRIVLYGSLATGLFRADSSDVDLAIEGVGIEAPLALTEALGSLFGRRVEIVDPERVSGFIRSAIERKGEVLSEPE